MAWNGSRVLAVVPARGGSKGIPGKNLREVGGRSLVARCGDLCLALPWLDRAVLSTDDDAIAAAGIAAGLDVPFRRPPELAGDGALSVDMWRHAWLQCERIDGRYDLSILLEPTSPLRQPADIEATVSALVDSHAAAAATVSVVPGHYTPHKTLVVDAQGRVGFFLADGARHTLRQSIPRFHHRNGICYAVRRDTLIERRHIIEEDCVAVVIDRPVINIDEPLDLELAEFLLARRPS